MSAMSSNYIICREKEGSTAWYKDAVCWTDDKKEATVFSSKEDAQASLPEQLMRKLRNDGWELSICDAE